MTSIPRCLECHFAMLYAGSLKQAVYYCDNEYCNRSAILVFKLES